MIVDPTDRVKMYVRNDSGRSNAFDCDCVFDHNHRVLLPLDDVVMVDHTDEGREVFVRGKVTDIDYLTRQVKIKPDSNFAGFGFTERWFDHDACIRFPSGDPRLEYEFMVFISSINYNCLKGSAVHKNGHRLRID
jgi:hypothetical protein